MMNYNSKQNSNIVKDIFTLLNMRINQLHIFKFKSLILIFSVVTIAFIKPGQVFGQSSSKLVELCNSVAGDEVTYLKDFYVELDAAGPDGKAPEQRFTIVLSKNNEYRFTVCNAEGSQGKAILQLYDVSKLYASTYNAQTGQTFQSFNFQCQKTGAYHLIVSFLDGKKGSAVVIASFVRTL